MIDPAKHSHERNFLESMLRKIPGFRGYLEKEYRRDSDHLTRKWMADQLQQSKRGLDDFLRGLVDTGQLDVLPAFERVRSRLDGLISKIRSADRGYSGVFDFVTVNETALDQVYQLDISLVDDAQALVDGIENIGKQSDAPGKLATNLLTKIDELDRLFARRGELLKGLSPS